MIIYLDTETTALYPGNVCQLSYIKQSGNKIRAKNFYFQVDEMDYFAEQVHGLSIEKLKKLSNGKRLKDNILEILSDFEKASLFVAHNAFFDINYLRHDFEQLGYEFPEKEVFCTMKNTISICKINKTKGNGYKYPKLNEMCAFFGVNDEVVLQYTKKAFGDSLGFHDARFDTMAMFLAITKGKEIYKDLQVLNKYL